MEVQLFQRILQSDSAIHLLLGDARQLGAEGSHYGFENWLHVRVKDRLDSLRLHVDDYNRELNDFVMTWIFLLRHALAFKVKDTDVIERCFIQILFRFEVQHISESVGWDAAVLKTFRENHVVFRYVKRELVSAVHGFDEVQLNDDLTR